MPARIAARHRQIPVKVVVERRPRTAPTPAAQPASPVAAATSAAHLQSWSEAHRRRVMWLTVGIGSLAIIIIWAAVFTAQIRGNAPTFFNDITQLVRDVKWPWEPEPITPQAQEIRQLEEQVFPQFQ